MNIHEVMCWEQFWKIFGIRDGRHQKAKQVTPRQVGLPGLGSVEHRRQSQQPCGPRRRGGEELRLRGTGGRDGAGPCAPMSALTPSQNGLFSNFQFSNVLIFSNCSKATFWKCKQFSLRNLRKFEKNLGDVDLSWKNRCNSGFFSSIFVKFGQHCKR